MSMRLSRSVVGEAEARAVSRVITEDGYLGMGNEVRLFEEEVAQYLGVKPSQVITVNTGTAALHAGLAEPIIQAEIDLVFTAGKAMQFLDQALPAEKRGGWAEDAAALAPVVTAAVRPGDVVMVKGSNGSKASLVAAALAHLGVAEQEARVAAEAQGKSA